MVDTKTKTLGEILRHSGVSRRGFLKFCTATASMMALPPGMVPAIAAALDKARRPSVIWLSFQECTGCTESLTRSHSPSLENLIFDHISLDYHHTLQVASGDAAEAAREEAMHANAGSYLVVVDGSIPLGNPGYSTTAGFSNLQILEETAAGAAAVIAVGTCAAFGGLPKADPNPTGAVSVRDIVTDKPVINVSGCPPIPVVITGVLAHYLTFGTLPELDQYGRPKAFYGTSIHDRCYRRPFYDKGLFASTFDDEGARSGWCLYKLGCKGPMTYNACATAKWNEGTSWPVESGHGCLGCSQPDFWDAGGFYNALSIPVGELSRTVSYATAAGLGLGAVAAGINHRSKVEANRRHGEVTVDDLEKTS
ncbi:MAG: hydrogenase small subunit [Gammaproteobacteria bacterium]|nr:hydrogenase small subunit [Gammaproteobacteria bacterium]MCP5406600.1 hydrogenase small subunit [Chromatiaceae bacterium]MCP5409436.1 hydrogenase small subunit [Chromatiaceae bacterium]MCP5444328.1 hydrogenase small subunit [Chromatiaceae bacterium]